MPTKPSSKTPPASPAKPAAANPSLASERFANATQRGDGVEYAAHHQGWGYARLSTQPGKLTLEFTAVTETTTSPQDRFKVDLATQAGHRRVRVNVDTKL